MPTGTAQVKYRRGEIQFLKKRKQPAFKRKRRFIRAAVLILLPAIALLVSQRMAAKTTYMITDGNRVLVHKTFATDPQVILKEAGFQLCANDTITTKNEDGMSEIHIRREQNIRINYYGEELEATSSGESVEELLTRLNLPWSEDDMLSVPPDAKTYDGMELTVAHVIRENQMYTSVISHDTIYCTDPALPEGVQKTVSQGEDGQLLCQATVTYLNGIEAERTLRSQQVVTQPVSEIIAVGSGPAENEPEEENPMAIIGDGILTLPTGEVLTYTEKVSCLATAYHCEGYVGKTATGTRARVGAIAVDPEVFPYGTRFYIATKDGEYVYGVATAEDCGSKQFIYGTRLDLFFDTKYECIQFGARSCDVYILG